MLIEYWDEGQKKVVPVSTNSPLPMAGGVIREPFSGTSTVTHVFAQEVQGFTISNDGESGSLTFAIHGDVFTVLAGEVFEGMFEPFQEVTVSTSIPFRAYGRG